MSVAVKSAFSPAIVIFTTAAAATASRIATLTGGRVYTFGPEGEGASSLLPRLFAQRIPIIGVCASGILIRLLASHLGDKHAEPAVIAVSQDGQHVVPLLGGHHGANRLAAQLAEGLGGTAAVTTASDTRFSVPLDEPPSGYVLQNRDAAKPAMADLLNGGSIAVRGADPFLAQAGYPLSDDGAVTVEFTTSASSTARLVYHPKVLVAGVGCERGADSDEVIGLVQRTLQDHGLSPQSLAAIATIDIKADESALHEAAAHFGVPLRLFAAAELAAEADRLPNPSEVVRAETGTPGVAEAAAVKAGRLLVDKRKSARATCAIGVSEVPLDADAFGRAPGVLHLVGIGPGEAFQRTASAVAALDASSDWVGYGLYLDLIADLKAEQQEHRFPLGQEEDRVRHALELAARGKTVALVCSGDAQIYAMATLVYELLNAQGSRAVSVAASRVAVETHPGISAFQMASARAGALIGHDFCCISLSDLLTPREAIKSRVKAAAKGDFVTALYNPRSQRRTDLIEKTKKRFLKHRPPETPVIVATSLGRPEERVEVTTLAAFDPASIDMMTIVLIGASQSRALKRGDGTTVAFTPRGYERKGGEAAE